MTPPRAGRETLPVPRGDNRAHVEFPLSFDAADGDALAPLAERLRPKTLDELVGQEHLLGPGKPLRAQIDRGRLPR